MREADPRNVLPSFLAKQDWCRLGSETFSTTMVSRTSAFALPALLVAAAAHSATAGK